MSGFSPHWSALVNYRSVLTMIIANVPDIAECPPDPMDRGSFCVRWEKNADKDSSAHASEYQLSLCKAV